MSSGTQRHRETRGHRLQSTSRPEISSDAARSSPCLRCQTARLQSKPHLTGAGGRDNATVFLHSSCTFLAKTLKSQTQSDAVSALSHPSALTDLHATT